MQAANVFWGQSYSASEWTLSVARESVREFVRTLASMTWDNPYIMTAMLEIKQEGKLSII